MTSEMVPTLASAHSRAAWREASSLLLSEILNIHTVLVLWSNMYQHHLHYFVALILLPIFRKPDFAEVVAR